MTNRRLSANPAMRYIRWPAAFFGDIVVTLERT